MQLRVYIPWYVRLHNCLQSLWMHNGMHASHHESNRELALGILPGLFSCCFIAAPGSDYCSGYTLSVLALTDSYLAYLSSGSPVVEHNNVCTRSGLDIQSTCSTPRTTKKNWNHFSIYKSIHNYACHFCAKAMLIFSVSFFPFPGCCSFNRSRCTGILATLSHVYMWSTCTCATRLCA